MFLSSIAELITLAALIPFLAALSEPQRLLELPVLSGVVTSYEIKDPQQILAPMAVIFAFSAILSASIRLLNLWMNGRVVASIGSDLSCNAYYRVLCQSYEKHLSRNSSSVINTVTNQVELVVIMLNNFLVVLTASILSLVILTALLFANWLVTLASIALFASVYGLVALINLKRLAINGERVAIGSRRQLQMLQEGLGSIRDVILEGNQMNYSLLFRDINRPFRISIANITFLSGYPRFLLEALGLVLIASLAWAFTYKQGNSVGLIPFFGAFAFGSMRMLPSLQQIYGGWAIVRSHIPALTDVLSLLDQPFYATSNLQSKNSEIRFDKIINFSNVSFHYKTSSGLILDDLQFHLLKGEKLGIIGTSGSGKSTMIDILMGLLKPSQGRILVDGIDLYGNEHSNRIRSWRSLISHVPQNIFLADSSIAQNIAFGVPKNRIDMARVQRAAFYAQLDDVIEGNKDGFHTIVGERGFNLSGGQRQRIGIARALYKNSSILLLDEATSALDRNTEQKVINAINNMSTALTIVMVAHRISSLSQCDRIIKIESGKIVEDGPPSQVL